MKKTIFFVTTVLAGVGLILLSYFGLKFGQTILNINTPPVNSDNSRT
ncbi:MAG: hypothetical protein WCV50_03080 [Patescibacteria group bacterium]